MRQIVSGLVAAVAVLAASAVPAKACGGGGLFSALSSCSPCGSPCGQTYAAPSYSYSGCNSGCGGWAQERLPDPVQQYYYVNQGPVYSGHGSFAPVPTYQESAVSGWNAYSRPYQYGYDGGRYANATNHYYDGAGVEGPAVYRYRSQSHYRPWRARTHYGYGMRQSYRYGYAPRRSYAPQYTMPQRQFYAPRQSMRYGMPRYSAPRSYGHREHVLRRYY